MLKKDRITLLIISETGGKIFEFKVRHSVLVAMAFFGLAMLLLFGLGLKSYFDARELSETVVFLKQQNALLGEEVEQIEQLEHLLLSLQKSHRQLRAILGQQTALEVESKRRDVQAETPYVTGIERLLQGQVHTYPGLWPVQGEVIRPFSETFPAVALVVPIKSLVRASGAGQVVHAGFDQHLGYLVVLDHGKGLISQYGYNSHLLVEVGDFVQQGQPIALSGRSGDAEIPSLYYAIRENGQPRDPVAYRLWL